MKEPTVAHSTFVIERDYPVPPEKVFAAFQDATKKRRWMGGDTEGFEVISFELDFRVGGAEHWRFRFKGGELIKNDGSYQDIIANERIVFVYSMSFGDKIFSSSQTTIELFKTAQGTKMLFTEQGAFFDGLDHAQAREEGTRELLNQLAKELARP